MRVKDRTATGKVLRLFAIDILVLAAVFLVAEFIVRLVAPQPVHRLLRHVYEADERGYRFKPNTSAIANNGYGDHLFSINSWRARDKEYGAKQSGEWRILSVGNSYNENQALDVEDIWSNVLESRLAEAYPDRVFSVINAGQAGWGLWNYYGYLEEMLPIIDPDVVVILFANKGDMQRDTRRPTPRPMKIWAGLPIYRDASLVQRVEFGVWLANETMEERSHAFVAFRRATFFPGIWLGITRVARLHAIYRDPDYGERMIEPTTEVLAGLRRLCEEHGARLVVLSVPSEEECLDSASRLRTQLERPDVSTLDFSRAIGLLRKITAGAEIPFYDPAPDLAAAEERPYFVIFQHWNELGNRIVAEGMQRFLEEQHLLGRGNGGPDDRISSVDPPSKVGPG